MKVYTSTSSVRGPLLIVEGTSGIAFKEICEIELASGETVTGQVLEVAEDRAVVQVFETTRGLSRDAKVRFTGRTATAGVSADMVGRSFDGAGRPIDGLDFVPDERRDINGAPINPSARLLPSEFIQTGVSTIDLMMSVVRGQKLPIFSMSGMPHNELAAQIARQARVLDGKEFVVVFCALGISASDAEFFRSSFEESGALSNAVLFLNLASDPSVERIMTPRVALTAAEYLAFDRGMQVLVVMTDVTNYCEALREIGAARQEVPGRRGYPGYMYTDLATLYERAGRIEGSEGSLTQIPILTMPGDDKTHPVPDLTGYITEGQILLDRGLSQRGRSPPITILGSLSRLKVGKGQLRDDAPALADQLYACYATGIELRDLVAVVGESALSERDLVYLRFARAFEERFIGQGFDVERSFDETLAIGYELLKPFPRAELKKLKPEHIERYL